MQGSGLRPRIVASADGREVVGHAGAWLLADLADVTGLTGAFSEALAPLRVRRAGHDPGRVAVDVAVMLADGGEAIADLSVLRDQPGLFGPVASDPTAWRVLADLDTDALDRLRAARAAARELAENAVTVITPIGPAGTQVGEHQQADEAIRHAIEITDRLGDQERVGGALSLHSDILWFLGRARSRFWSVARRSSRWPGRTPSTPSWLWWTTGTRRRPGTASGRSRWPGSWAIPPCWCTP